MSIEEHEAEELIAEAGLFAQAVESEGTFADKPA
jgi:hypothetical protein